MNKRFIRRITQLNKSLLGLSWVGFANLGGQAPKPHCSIKKNKGIIYQSGVQSSGGTAACPHLFPDSHMGTVFWKSDKSPEKNDFVYFNFQHELLPKNLKVLSKKIVCIGGESLKIDDQFITCQDKKYPIKRNKKNR
ncbi:hypothetical protein [Candidatus Thiodubiliella endoseptemdiera]|uniref:hypothetical protein n=1 Tax=Candidatus Thiodubiliella endoseptemdiera TaxID=2738886 RepID=UPI0034DE22EB